MTRATEAETRFPLRQLPKRAGIAVHISGVIRWAGQGLIARDGSRGRLKTSRIGGRTFTTLRDFDEFNARLAAEPGEPVPTASRRRLAEIERAEAELDALGV